MRIDFTVAGFQKCGTTWLYNVLSQVRMISLPVSDESHYFNVKYNLGPPELCCSFRNKGENTLKGDFTSSYIIDPLFPEKFYFHNPNGKVILMVREPISRAESHFWHEMKKGRINYSWAEIFSNYDLYHSWIETGNYISYINNLEKYIPKRNIHVVALEAIRADPVKAVKGVLAFLDIEEYPNSISGPINIAPEYSRKIKKYRSEFALPNWLRKNLLYKYSETNKALFDWLGFEISDWKYNNDENISSQTPKIFYAHGVREFLNSHERHYSLAIDVASTHAVLSHFATSDSNYQPAKKLERNVNKNGLEHSALSFDDGLVSSAEFLMSGALSFISDVFFCPVVGFIEQKVLPLEMIILQFLRKRAKNSANKGDLYINNNEFLVNYRNIYAKLKFENYRSQLAALRVTHEDAVEIRAAMRKIYCNWDVITELSRVKEIKIASHSYSHRPLSIFDGDDLRRELLLSKKYLESKLEIEIDTLSLPYGDANTKVLLAAYQCGYRAILGTEVTKRNIPPGIRNLKIVQRFHVEG